MAKSSGTTRTSSASGKSGGGELSQQEKAQAEKYGFEVEKMSHIPNFGQKMTYTYEVTHNYDALDKNEWKEAKSIAEKKGGHYDDDMETFVMPTQSSANEMVRELLKIKKK